MADTAHGAHGRAVRKRMVRATAVVVASAAWALASNGAVADAAAAQAANAPIDVIPICWAVTDDTAEILRFNLSATRPIPPSASPLSRVYTGEGMAYRASHHDLVMFSDGPSRMWTYDLETGTETAVGPALPGHVDGAALWVDPADPSREELWIAIAERLYRIDPDTAVVLEGPHALSGIGGSSGGLAFEPRTGEMWMTDDFPESALYRISRPDFRATKVADIRWPDGSRPDAESLDFGAQGQLYTEEDFGDRRGKRYILEIDRVSGVVTPVAGPIPGIGDLEGLGCNGGAEVFQPADPAVDIEKSVNSYDADEAPGPDVPAGTTAFFRYVVTNTGNLDLRDVVVTDDRGVAVICPSGTATIGHLAVGEVVECDGTSIAVAEEYRNVGEVTAWADPPPVAAAVQQSPMMVTDSDPANYHGYVWPPPPGTDPDTTPVHDPDPSYNTPERFLSRDEASTSVETDITLPETGAGDRAGEALVAGIMLLIAGTLLRRGARRPSPIGR